MEILTDQEIKADIQEYQKRISAAREKLESLPEGHLGKKREHQRRLFEDEIGHVEGLIRIATEALNDEYPWT